MEHLSMNEFLTSLSYSDVVITGDLTETPPTKHIQKISSTLDAGFKFYSEGRQSVTSPDIEITFEKKDEHVFASIAGSFSDAADAWAEISKNTKETDRKLRRLVETYAKTTSGNTNWPSDVYRTYDWKDVYDYGLLRHRDGTPVQEETKEEREKAIKRSKAVYKAILESDTLTIKKSENEMAVCFPIGCERTNRFWIADHDLWVVSLATDVKTRRLQVIVTWWGPKNNPDPTAFNKDSPAVVVTGDVREFLRNHTE